MGKLIFTSFSQFDELNFKKIINIYICKLFFICTCPVWNDLSGSKIVLQSDSPFFPLE